jgi:predicted GNAT family N-acyltransferase
MTTKIDTAQASRQFRVKKSDGSKIIYTIRGLSEPEVKAWATFCASVFSYKANPPPADYFERHYLNDPEKEASFIRVAFCDDKMVASCRVFRRQVSIGSGEYAEAGGIGEVCTDKRHRKRGLSSQVMKDAIQIISESGMELSFLHSAPDFFPVYEKGGYTCTVTQWSVALIDRPILVQSALKETPRYSVRLARFPDDTKTLMKVHQEFSEHRFAGCIRRSESYWEKYIGKELEGSLYVLVEKTKNEIAGWLSVEHRGKNKIRTSEFGCVDSRRQSYCVLGVLLNQAMKDMVTITEPTFELIIPTFCMEEIRSSFDSHSESRESYIDWSETIMDSDKGWMYKPISSHGMSMSDLNKTVPHLIWPADSF